MSDKKYTTIQQHEPLRVPSNWTGQEKMLVVQLEEILDDIYRRFGRLRFEDLRPEVRKMIIESAEGFSSLEQTVEGFDARVEDAEGNATQAVQTANQVMVEVGNIQVGGTNLSPDTRLMESWAKTGGTRPVTLSVDGEGFGVLAWPADANKTWARAMQSNDLRKPYSVYRDKDVTVSFEFRGPEWVDNDYLLVYFYVDEGQSSYFRSASQLVRIPQTDAWKKITLSVTMTDDFFTGGTGTLRQEGLVNIFLANNCAGACEVRKFKVEIGNKATDWSPAPEDGAYTTSAVLDRTGIHLNTGGTFTVDSQNFDVDGEGNMTAKAGSIGGWEIAPGSLHSGSGTSHVRLSTEDATYAIWAGAEAAASAPFRVSRDGKVYLTKLYVTDENGNAQANPVNLSGSWWRTNRAVQSMEVSGNTLTITLYDGTTVNFNKASVVAIDQTWSGGRQTITTTTDGITLSGETTTSVNSTPSNLTWGGTNNATATFNVTSDKGTIVTGMKVNADSVYEAGYEAGYEAAKAAVTVSGSIASIRNTAANYFYASANAYAHIDGEQVASTSFSGSQVINVGQ